MTPYHFIQFVMPKCVDFGPFSIFGVGCVLITQCDSIVSLADQLCVTKKKSESLQNMGATRHAQ